MEIKSSERPVPVSTPAGPPRMDPRASAGAATELPPEASVQAPAEPEAVSLDLDRLAGARARLDQAFGGSTRKDFGVDLTTRELIFKVIDRDTGEVLRQVPDDALLRLRTYTRALTERLQAAAPTSTVA